jgi:endonuclease YncB( thermonuclease family)
VISRKIRSAGVFVAVFACIVFFHSYCCAWQGTVVGVPDAGLLLVSHENQIDKIGLYGIECPERGQPFWEQARVLASHLAMQKTVEVTPLYPGYDGSQVSLVRVEGSKDYLNVQLVSHGLAWVKPKECSANICADWRALENLARSNAIGLWMDPNPIPPWEWKKEQRRAIREHGQQPGKSDQ